MTCIIARLAMPVYTKIKKTKEAGRHEEKYHIDR